MDFTPEEKTRLIIEFDPLLSSVVRQACVFYNLRWADVNEDLYQVAVVTFLRHLQNVKCVAEIGGCKLELKHQLAKAIRSTHVVSISRAKFRSRRKDFEQVPLENAMYMLADKAEEQWVSDLLVEEFLDSRPPHERKALLMRVHHNTRNKELMAVLGVENEMGVTRFFTRIRRAYRQFADEKKGG